MNKIAQRNRFAVLFLYLQKID